VSSPVAVEVARSLDELERLRPAWDELPWEREEAAYEYFTARLATRPDVIGPLAAVVTVEGRPVGGLAGRLELRHLATAVGYKVVYAPQVRVLQVVDGGIALGDGSALPALRDVVGEALRSGAADVATLPPLELGSEELAAFSSLGGALTRQPFIVPWTRRLLTLPATFDAFLASRSHKTRKGVRRDARRLESAFGDRLRLEIVCSPDRAEQLIGDADRVARSTYQRRLGAGVADTPEQRALIEVGLEHRWVRGYLLYVDEDPIAYWLCSVYGDTMLLRTGGFDPAYSEDRVGIHLLMRVIEDACSDPALRRLDFGPGDASYKEQFSNESRRERNLVLFAPNLRARRINVTRSAILGPARLARAGLDATDLTDRVRSAWRGRLGER
jgi:CelD/BcsL family acetyltransferase involved in cellulose biosynthesis